MFSVWSWEPAVIFLDKTAAASAKSIRYTLVFCWTQDVVEWQQHKKCNGEPATKRLIAIKKIVMSNLDSPVHNIAQSKWNSPTWCLCKISKTAHGCTRGTWVLEAITIFLKLLEAHTVCWICFLHYFPLTKKKLVIIITPCLQNDVNGLFCMQASTVLRMNVESGNQQVCQSGTCVILYILILL